MTSHFDYKIVLAPSANELEDTVRKHILVNWVPLGAPFTMRWLDTDIWVQAMTKEDLKTL